MEAPVAPSLQDESRGPRQSAQEAAQCHDTYETSNASLNYHQQRHGGGSFHALYTKQKTQKRKIWQDGRIAVQPHAVNLHSASPPPGGGDPVLDTCILTPSQIQAIRQGTLANLETEKFLVQVEGPWRGTTVGGVPSWGTTSNKIAPSAAMLKVMQRKFRKPAVKRPPPPSSGQQPAFLQRRKRPLQPGELHRQYYGDPPVQQQQPRATQYPLMHQQQKQMIYQQMNQRQQQSSHQNPSMSRHLPTPPQQRHDRYDVSDAQACGQHHPSASDSSIDTSKLPPHSGYHAAPTQDHDRPLSHLSHSARGAPPLNAGPPRYRQEWNDSHPVDPVGASISRKRRDFVSNSFDPKGFYGEDGEEEEDDFSDHNGGSDSLWRQPSNVDHTHNDARTAPNSFVASTSTTAAAEAGHDQDKALTTDDLLDLFGGDSTQAESITEMPDTVRNQAAHVGNVEPESGSLVEGNDDFVLPPPSDSSDDEDD